MPSCPHQEFIARVDVGYDGRGYLASVYVCCKHCKAPFVFDQSNETVAHLTCKISTVALRERLKLVTDD